MRALASSLVVLFLLLPACSEEGAGNEPTAGASGTAGTGGSGGRPSPGTAGSGGGAGTAGNAGTAGSAGSGGGAGGSGGMGGTGGSAGGGGAEGGSDAGTRADRAGGDRGAAGDGGAAAVPGAVSLFDGTSLDGWDGNPRLWSIKDGALTGINGNQQLLYTRADYSNFRLLVTSRMVKSNDHLGICFWGGRNAGWNFNGCLLVIPPSGSLYDYGPQGQIIANSCVSGEAKRAWHTTEILANRTTGEVKVAVDGVNMTNYKYANTGRLKNGPIGMQLHSGGGQEAQYKDIFIEVDPKEDRLLTAPAGPGACR
jgi:hypothetical protein